MSAVLPLTPYQRATMSLPVALYVAYVAPVIGGLWLDAVLICDEVFPVIGYVTVDSEQDDNDYEDAVIEDEVTDRKYAPKWGAIMTAKIYVWPTTIYGNGDVVGVAVDEDGKSLACHFSSNEAFLRHDMGITSDWKHDKYKVRYPDGYELVYVSVQELRDSSNADFEAAYKIWEQSWISEREATK